MRHNQFFVTLLFVLVIALNGSANSQFRIKVSGFVVARDKLNVLGNAANNLPKTELFIVRVEQHEPIARESRYIKVYYQWRAGEPTLPAEFFKSMRQWRFVLARVPECDGTVKKMVTIYNKDGKPSPFNPELLPTLLDGAKDEVIPLDRVLPCYFLEPANVKLLKLET